MKKATIFSKDRTTLELAALFVFALVLVANLVVVRFSEGYFGYFNIPLAEVNYVPQLYDYVRIAFPVIIIAGIVTAVVFGLMRLSVFIGSLLAGLTKPSEKAVDFVRRHIKIFKGLVTILGIIINVGIWIVVGWALWIALYNVSADAGKISAGNMKSFSSISSVGDNLQKVIIYKADNEIIIKTYDTSKKEFVDGYDVLYGSSYSPKTIHL